MLKFNNNLFNRKSFNKAKYAGSRIDLRDYGDDPFVIDLEEATEQNNTYRTALWTGENLQLVLMSIKPGEDIGLEIHEDTDQFFMIEEGRGLVEMGPTRNNLNTRQNIGEGYGFIVPAKTWHNFTNTGRRSVKLLSIYAPPHHPFGTVHNTKKEAQDAEPGYISRK